MMIWNKKHSLLLKILRKKTEFNNLYQQSKVWTKKIIKMMEVIENKKWQYSKMLKKMNSKKQ